MFPQYSSRLPSASGKASRRFHRGGFVSDISRSASRRRASTRWCSPHVTMAWAPWLVGGELDEARRRARTGSLRRARWVLVPDCDCAPTHVAHTTMCPSLSSPTPKRAIPFSDPLPAPARLCGGPDCRRARNVSRAHSDVAAHLLRPLKLRADAATATQQLGLGDSRGPRAIPRARCVRGSIAASLRALRPRQSRIVISFGHDRRRGRSRTTSCRPWVRSGDRTSRAVRHLSRSARRTRRGRRRHADAWWRRWGSRTERLGATSHGAHLGSRSERAGW